MPRIAMRKLLEAGVHFGHQTKRWNPRMAPYIYGSRNGIHIVNLGATVELFDKAYNFVTNVVAKGGTVLFVGTKRQAQDVVAEEARRCGQYFITQRWLGGTLTNWRTIKTSIETLKTLDKMEADGTYARLSKKEARRLERQREKLERSLGGIKTLNGLPGAIFIIDPNKEDIAVHEAKVLGIPVVAVADTNCDPGPIDFLIPGNDDAIRAIRLFASNIADACLEGQKRQGSERALEGGTEDATYTAADSERSTAEVQRRGMPAQTEAE